MIGRPVAWVLAVLLGLALAGMGFQAKKAGEAQARYLSEHAAFAVYRADAERQARVSAAAELEERKRINMLQTEALDDAHKKLDAALADAGHARAAAGLLRQRATALAAASARCAADAAGAIGPSQPTSAPGDLLADMLGRLDQAAGELADFAERSHIAGQLCERDYRALSPP